MGDFNSWIGIVVYDGDNMPTVTLVGDEDDDTFKELITKAVGMVKEMPTKEGQEIAITPIRISGNCIAFFPEDQDETIDNLVEGYW